LAKEDKVDICHFDADLGQFQKISISESALPAHIDEHGPATGNKDMNVTAANMLPGSYNCTCKSGFIGDGLNCCIIDFQGLETAIKNAPTGLSTPAYIALCNGKIEFPNEIVVLDKAFELVCPVGTCTLDGRGANRLFNIANANIAFSGAILSER
jgi:hypothetical protein